METQILTGIVLIFGLSILVLYVCNRLHISTVVGLIVTGVIAGPNALSLVRSASEVEVIAEIGIILLLFTIGLELSFRTLWRLRGSVLAGGGIQVLLTCAAAAVIAWIYGRSIGESILIGFLISLSSTAIVLKVLQERGEVDTPHGNLSLGILIFQDLAVVPMMMMIPLLAGSVIQQAGEIELIILQDLAILAFIVVSAKWLVPWALFQIAKTKNRELFLLFIIAICIGVAWLTSIAGLSLALGALLAGLIISESEYSHQAIGNVIPFRDVFASFFFISVGMLLDVTFLAGHITLLLAICAVVILLKLAIGSTVPLMLGYPVRTIVMVGLALAQIGEFAFILSWSGLEYGLLTPEMYQLLIAVTLLTMAATPFLISAGPALVNQICRLPLPARFCGEIGGTNLESGLRDHLIIIGYGLNGRNLAKAAKYGKIPYIIVEMNPETVRMEREKGEAIVYGDATNESVLRHAGIERARVVVVVINDPVSTRRIASTARVLNPHVRIIVRTRYLQEVNPLRDLGADEVIPEEFETSVEIFTRVLRNYLIPKDDIEKFAREVRANAYQVLRTPSRLAARFSELSAVVPEIEIATFRVADGAMIAGKTLGELRLRRNYRVTVVAIQRGSELITNPDGDTRVESGDRAVVLGMPEKISDAAFLFTGGQ